MSPSKAPFSTERLTSTVATPVSYSAPGKVFLLGEYSVLAGGKACVAAVGPRFKLSVLKEGETGTSFHPQSPAGKLLSWAADRKALVPAMRFDDPLGGAGGIGASTAQFGLAYRALAEINGWDPRWKAAWTLYRELSSSEPVPPSGADLAVQMLGGVSIFQASPMPEAWTCPSQVDWSSILVFSATSQPGRKVATHEHLRSLADNGFLRESGGPMTLLRAISERGFEAARAGKPHGLGQAFREYAEALQTLGLELPVTTEDREALQRISGVAGVKGMGALQADGVIVLLEDEGLGREEVLRVARDRDLVLLADGLKPEEGIRCDG